VGIKSKNISIIDQGAIVDGTFSCKGRLVIKGTVKGTLLGDIVIIAKEGAVYADIKAASITIGGIFEGEIEGADELIILSEDGGIWLAQWEDVKGLTSVCLDGTKPGYKPQSTLYDPEDWRIH